MKKSTRTGFKTKEVIVLLTITCIISLATGFLIKSSINTNIEEKEITTEDKTLKDFIKNYNYIVDNYYQDVDKSKLLEGAISGLLEATGDPYSLYMDETSSDSFDKQLNGSYQGIGVEIANTTTNNIVILGVFDDSPASKAGLQKGDIIKSIDGESFENKKSTDLTQYISNSKNSNFEFIVIRNSKEIKATVKRENVIIKSVSSKVYEKDNKKIGYIAISIFAANTDVQFEETLKKLESQKIDSLIIDLRNNSGGHLSAVQNMISQFLNKKHVIYQMQTKYKTTKYYSTGKTTKKYPIVLLGNNESASASEVMIAALKEEYGATLVGTKTYGKGTVQELVTLSGNTEYKFTTKKWLTPKGNWINEKGITPDIEVTLPDTYQDNPVEENDTQLQKALEELQNK